MSLSRGQNDISIEDFKTRLCVEGNLSAEDTETIITIYNPENLENITWDWLMAT